MKRGWLGCAAAAALAWAFVGPVQAEKLRNAVEAFAAAGQHARVASGRQFFGDARYAGSETCKSCHEDQYRSWRSTWHSKMERWPSADTVVGDFDDREIRFRNLRVRTPDGKEAVINPTARVFRRDGRYGFTLHDRDDAANDQTWFVAKVLGGRWDQGYEVQLGSDNYYPAPIRWSVEQKDWIVGGFNPADWWVADGTPDGRPFTPAELPRNRVAEAKCNGCHTTGFSFAKAADGVWKAHMNGRAEIGVACESCHGPGSRHVAEAEAARAAGTRLDPRKTTIVNPLLDLNAEQSTQVCGQCHGRGTHKEQTDLAFPTGFLPGDTDLKARFRLWSYSGTAAKSESDYFWPNDWASRNRQQYQDFQKSGHYAKAGMSCVSCHAFHGPVERPQLRAKIENLCTDCHRADGPALRPNAEMMSGSDKSTSGVICVDCHMPRIGSRSRATSKSGHQWDTTSHVFAVATPQMEQTLGVRSACTSCHTDDDRPPGSMRQELIDGLRRQAQEVRDSVAATQSMLARVDLARPGAAALVGESRAKLGFVLADNSKGAHHVHRTRSLLREARLLAEQALALPVGSKRKP